MQGSCTVSKVRSKISHGMGLSLSSGFGHPVTSGFKLLPLLPDFLAGMDDAP